MSFFSLKEGKSEVALREEITQGVQFCCATSPHATTMSILYRTRQRQQILVIQIIKV